MHIRVSLLLCCLTQTVYVIAVVNNRGHKPGWHWQRVGGKALENVQPSRTLGAISPVDIINFFDTLKAKIAFPKQLRSISLYIVTDDYGSPIISHYPSDTGKPVPVPAATTKRRAKRRPVPSKIVEEFIQMFNGSQSSSGAQSTTHDINQVSRHMPKVQLYFMDPNACTAQIQELRRQGKEAQMDVVTLNDYVQHLENVNRDFDPILLPMAGALTRATNNGKEVFKGTPIFTTDPPIVKTTRDNVEGDFNPATDKLVVFFSPEEAQSLYRKAWWNKNTTIDTAEGREYYKIVPGAMPWSPQIRSASFETLCQRIHSNEPYWASLLQLVPPKIDIDKDTESMLKDRATTQTYLLSLFYSLRSLLR